ncbi:hypothetical protein [Apilactobacillus xinyiensis]|uniref:Uncharacterized protein n=1 Tax=Apilactobacillus xinyiensis TaxID=2841032 RepID=A0ABT0I089_9LACO|nr:hypothetical protein [Apilactobacillus xinyiensis]MCK8624044.1 hypothetical protein [Apilactobacillus xinyiensis]MCL0311636.1 hypothetical protein [Apilactobacillus xinyiensis]MCL0318219.1 hypothetical protein [Apilactobacillus xinyiensis]MCL0329322.1 hypothetical protein [Apilactobacillus xinyiensis]
MLNRTKQFLRSNGYYYKKTYIRPLFTPDNVYVFRFGKKHLNNRLIVRYGHKWTGRQKINEIDLRLHKQNHPRIFNDENGLLIYLEGHLKEHEQKLAEIKAKELENKSASK